MRTVRSSLQRDAQICTSIAQSLHAFLVPKHPSNSLGSHSIPQLEGTSQCDCTRTLAACWYSKSWLCMECSRKKERTQISFWGRCTQDASNFLMDVKDAEGTKHEISPNPCNCFQNIHYIPDIVQWKPATLHIWVTFLPDFPVPLPELTVTCDLHARSKM